MPLVNEGCGGNIRSGWFFWSSEISIIKSWMSSSFGCLNQPGMLRLCYTSKFTSSGVRWMVLYYSWLPWLPYDWLNDQVNQLRMRGAAPTTVISRSIMIFPSYPLLTGLESKASNFRRRRICISFLPWVVCLYASMQKHAACGNCGTCISHSSLLGSWLPQPVCYLASSSPLLTWSLTSGFALTRQAINRHIRAKTINNFYPRSD
jgi:hypothetical protein